MDSHEFSESDEEKAPVSQEQHLPGCQLVIHELYLLPNPSVEWSEGSIFVPVPVPDFLSFLPTPGAVASAPDEFLANLPYDERILPLLI